MIKKVLRKFFPMPAQTSESAFKDLYAYMNKKAAQLEKRIIQLEAENRDLKNFLYETMDPKCYPYALKQWYQNNTGEPLNLANPKTYNEKIQWLKLNDQDPRKTKLADKYLVRDWIKEKVGEQYLIPLLGVYRRADEIDFSSLPEEYVIKPNHASGMKIIIRDGDKPDPESICKTADNWLKANYAFKYGFELHYNDIPRRLMIEKYLKTETGKAPEFKLWCFNGKCRLVELILKNGKKVLVSFYDQNWNLQPFRLSGYQTVRTDYPEPDALPEMIRIAEILAADFLHVRVDFYLLDHNEIKIGELTFYPASGIHPWDPPEADQMIGDMLELPL